MGNSFGRRSSVKVMKITGETFTLKTPVRAGSVLASHPPGHVLLESEAVKHYGLRAKPLEPHQELKPKRLYFLVELPKVPAAEEKPRRVRSVIQMSAKDRLESLLLARRSASDLTIMRPPPPIMDEEKKDGAVPGAGVRVKMRLPRAEVERLMAESRDGAEVAEKIVGLCMAANAKGVETAAAAAAAAANNHAEGEAVGVRQGLKVKSREKKRVGFLPISEGGEIHVSAVTAAS